MSLFFTSYARADNDNSLLAKAAEDLRKRVRAKLGAASVEDVGFFDTRDIKTGAEWQQILGEALRSARVLVCMCSPTYFNSEYCAKEFEVFRLRRQQAGAAFANRGVIIPVIWEAGPMPASLSKYQYKDTGQNDAGQSEDYKSSGLSSLRRVKGQRGRYAAIIEALADDIKNAIQSVPVLPPYPQSVVFDTLPRSFHNPEDKGGGLALAVIHPLGPGWSPAGDGLSIARTIETVASPLKLPWREILVDATWTAKLAEVKERREALVVVTDAATATAAASRPVLEALDQAALPFRALLVGSSGAPMDTGAVASQPAAVAAAPVLPTMASKPTGAAETLRVLLPNLSQASPGVLTFPLDNVKALNDRLTESIARLMIVQTETAPAARVDSPALVESAKQQGIAVHTRPTVSGPSEVRS
jgi:hypothetical protein